MLGEDRIADIRQSRALFAHGRLKMKTKSSAKCDYRGTLSVVLRSGNVATELIEMPEWPWGNLAPFLPPVTTRAYKIIVPISGWVVYVDSIVPAGYEFKLVEGHTSAHIWPGKSLVLLFGPGAVVQVTTYGSGQKDSQLPHASPFYHVFDTFNEGTLRGIREKKRRERDSCG